MNIINESMIKSQKKEAGAENNYKMDKNDTNSFLFILGTTF